MRVLSTLHCVHFSEMDQELQRQIPELLRAAFSGQTLDIDGVLPREMRPPAAGFRRLLKGWSS